MSKIKKINPVFLVFIFIGFAFLYFIFFNKKTQPSKLSDLELSQPPLSKADLVLQKMSLSEIAQRPVIVDQKKVQELTKASGETQNSKCFGVYSWMAAKTAREIREQFFQNIKQDEMDCLPKNNSNKGYNIERCLKKDLQGEDEKVFEGKCNSLFVGMRSRAISELHAGNHDYRNMDLTVLTHVVWDESKNVWNDNSVKYSEEDKKRFQMMTRALMERLPNDVGVLNAHLFALDPTNSNSSKPDLEKYQHAVIDRGLLLSPKDKTLFEYRLQLYFNSNAESSILNFIRDHPQESLGYYYYGCYQWQKNSNKAEAVRYLDQALKLEPQDSRYQNISKTMNSMTPEQKKYIIEMHTSFWLDVE